MRPSTKQIISAVEASCSDLIMLDFSAPEEVISFIQNIQQIKEAAQEAKQESLVSVLDFACQTYEAQKDFEKNEQIFSLALSYAQDLLQSGLSKKEKKEKAAAFLSEVKMVINPKEVISYTMSTSQSAELPEFLSSTHALVDEIERDLLALEKDPQNEERVNNVFRAFHTIKGESGLLGISNLNNLAHEAENVMEKIRSQQFSCDSQIVSALLKILDGFRNVLQKIKEDPQEGLRTDVSEFVLGIMNIEESFSEKKDGGEVVRMEEDPEEKGVESVNELSKEKQQKKEKIFVATAPELDLSEGADILAEFIVEGRDHLEKAEESILELENDPRNKEAINNIFRSFHTIKGIASFLNLDDIRILAHEAETMLDMVRTDILAFEGDVADATFSSVDHLRKLLSLLASQIKNKGVLKEEYHDVGELIGELRDIISFEKAEQPSPKKPIGKILVEEECVTEEELEEALYKQAVSSPEKKVGEILIEENAASQKDVNQALSVQAGSVVEETIKISVKKLDALNDLVGELVIGATQVIQNKIVAQSDDQRLAKDVSQLILITRSLQEISMSMRLVPVRSTFQKMVRLVRDLSKKSGKEISVQISGENTEIDKNMVEIVGDPLVHIIRNAVDHGIEASDQRVAKGKPPVGNIRLDAYHKAGNVVVEINDDGGGLNKEKIFRKAIDRGLVKEGVELSDNKIFNMIFEPGFSTADNITDVSGRGVGMDVVRRNVEKMRGKIEIESALDKGSIFKILLPITLAIIDGIIVKVAGERYIFQVESVIEFVHPSQDDVFTVEGKGEMMKVHDDLYPIVRLDRCLGIEKEEKNAEEMVACIVESDFGRMCILVDELIGQQQVVIKNLGEKMKDIKGITGSTILGDGRVGLILDVNGIGELFR